MSAHIDFQVIEHHGKPAFVVIPYEEFQQLEITRKPVAEGNVPHEVVGAHLMDGEPLVKAWRKYLGLTQQALAERAGMPQSALARIESGRHKPRLDTLRKLARAMNLTLEQLEPELTADD
ncbi:MAG TPA: helix-turn-helix domain-containing protein [Piscirickettsiaceae bacterium]|nr:helix-turn-helix domain-containing protein [Piscirickettsiaceae bacterium]HIQ40935.1 helix-turn-helix domain-containing protein [Sulfurivirga caldicuralii]